MSRQLIALKKRRFTGTDDVHAQLAAFERLDILATARNPTGHHVIECVAHTHQVRPHFTALQWSVIRDEHIGTGFVRQNRKTLTNDRPGRHKKNVHQQHQNPAKLLGAPYAGG